MKIIPTWPRALSHVLRTLAEVSLSVFFSFGWTYVLLDYFQVVRVFFVFSFFSLDFFPRYQFVEFAKCTICFFFHTNRIID